MKTLMTGIVALLASQAIAEEAVLTLDEALRIAHERHPLIRQSKASVGVMESRAEQARGVLLPQVGASAQYTRSHGAFARAGSASSAGGGPTSPGTTNTFSFGLSATQTLWDFGAIERLRAAGFTREAQAATQRATQLQVALGVRRAYFAAAAQVALVRVAEETLKNDTLHLGQVQAMVNVGQKTAIDLAQAQTLTANGQLGLINAKNGLHLALAALVQAVGALEPKVWTVDETQLGPITNETDELPTLVTLAVEQRPELASLRHQQEAIIASTLAATGGYLPTLGASGSVSEGGTAIATLSPNWAFGASLSWNLFNGGQTTGQRHEAQYQADLLEAQLDAELLQVRVDVEQARATIEDGRSAVEAAIVAEASARAQLSLADGRLRAGVGSVLELSDAQVLHTNAAAQLVQTRLTLSTARAQLLAALGVTP